ncbi:hypothetical protein B0H14DRAFT_3712262 [Mycena olivaceomarginata]|nr:hypothetical protein B0H14DRAFT_3712262 [Mycena olivaceomarginata]
MTCVFLVRATEAFLTPGFSLWCSTNWGALLQPAPLSISLLGAILILASSTADFSLIDDVPEGAPEYKWQYATRPESFKACLEQMAGDGSKVAVVYYFLRRAPYQQRLAFETAQAQMEIINNSTSDSVMPKLIKEIVGLIIDGSKEDIQSLFLSKINDLKDLSKKCLDAANTTDSAFANLVGLAQEMVLACTYVLTRFLRIFMCSKGQTEQAIDRNKVHLAVLDQVKAEQAASIKQAKAQVAFAKKVGPFLMRQSYSKAESGFYTAVNDVPSGWTLVGMEVVGDLAKDPKAPQAGLNSYSNLTGQQGQTAVAPEPAPVAPTTSPNGDSQDGGLYIQAALESQKTELDPSAPFSQKLSPYIDDALVIIAAILKVAGSSASIEDNTLEPQVAPTEQLIMNLQGLSTSANLVLQQPGSAATGPATLAPADQAQAAEASGAAMKVTQTRANLEASRGMYEKYTDELTQQQQAITTTIGNITQTQLTDVTLAPLRAQFSQLVQFFDHVASLLNDVMDPSLTDWIHTLTSAEGEEKKVAGITLSKFMQNLIYTGMMTHSRQVGSMLLFPAGSTAEDKKALVVKLQKAQAALAESTKGTNNKISALVLNDQRLVVRGYIALMDFNTTITARLNAIENALKAHIPAVTQPVPAHVKAITNAHAKDTARTRALQAGVNPMFTLQSAF